jgi:flagellar motor switch protein FliM
MGISEIASGRHRNKKSEDILPYVERYFLQVAERLRSRQVNRSASDIPVRVAAVDSTTLQDTLQNPEFRDGVVYSILSSTSLHDSGCVMLQYGLISRLMEKGYGAQGDIYEPQIQARTLPHCTRRFIERLLKEICSDLQSFLPGNKKISFQATEPSITEPNWAPQERGTDVFVAMIDVGPLAQPYGLLSIILPVHLFEMVFGLKASRNTSEGNAEDGGFENTRVFQLPVDIVAELDRFSISYAELKNMMIGDFIPLTESLQVSLRVNNRVKFHGEFGEISGFRAVRIEQSIMDDDS